MSPTRAVCFATLFVSAAGPAVLAQTPGPATRVVATPAAANTDADDVFAIGKSLFDAYASPEIKQAYEFPSRAQWDEFARRLEKTRETGSLADLAAYETEAKAALIALRALPDYKDYADWLEERIDEIEVAKQASAPQPKPTPSPTPTPSPRPSPTPRPGEISPPLPTPSPTMQPRPTPTPAVVANPGAGVPLYDLWVTRLRGRPRPERADEFLGVLKKTFTSEGVAPELAWLAETESTFNPQARSPSGARGLFQLMPVTAKAQGLSLLPFDERTNPEKSARAAATLLRRLHGRFASWPLALAAYNVGEGRVSRTLKERDAKTFAEIADSLPTETRLYVPRVLATLTIREGMLPATLPAPR